MLYFFIFIAYFLVISLCILFISNIIIYADFIFTLHYPSYILKEKQEDLFMFYETAAGCQTSFFPFSLYPPIHDRKSWEALDEDWKR